MKKLLSPGLVIKFEQSLSVGIPGNTGILTDIELIILVLFSIKFFAPKLISVFKTGVVGVGVVGAVGVGVFDTVLTVAVGVGVFDTVLTVAVGVGVFDIVTP